MLANSVMSSESDMATAGCRSAAQPAGGDPMGENRRESTAAAGAVNAQDDKLERGRERPPGEERRCSDLHHPSLQPSLLRAGCFPAARLRFSSSLLHLGGRKLRPRLLYYLLLPSTSPLWGRGSFCVVVFLKPHQSVEITLIFLCCSGLKGKPKSLSA